MVDFNGQSFNLKGFHKKEDGLYEAIANDNRKYGFGQLECWLNLDDLETSTVGCKLKAGKSLQSFSNIIKKEKLVRLVAKDGKVIADKDCGKLFSLASCKFDENFQGYYNENGKPLKFTGLNSNADGLKTIVDEHAVLRLCDFINPFFRLSALRSEDGSFVLETKVELRRFFAKSDDNGHLHIYDDRGFVKDEHKLNIWVPYSNPITNEKSVRLFKSFLGGHSVQTSDQFDSVHSLYETTAARDLFLKQPMIVNVKDLYDAQSGDSKISINFDKWDSNRDIIRIKGIKKTAKGVKILDQANNVVAQEGKFDYVDMSNLVMVNDIEAAFKTGTKGMRKVSNYTMPADISMNSLLGKAAIKRENGFWLNWAASKIDVNGQACFDIGKTMFRLGGIRSDAKGVFLTNKNGETVARAGEGNFFNLNDLVFDQGSDICYVKPDVKPTRIERAKAVTSKTIFETSQTQNENIFFRMGSLAPHTSGKYYLYHYKKKFVVEGLVRSKDGRLTWLDKSRKVVGVDGKHDWISIKDLDFNDQKQTVSLKDSYKFFSLRGDTSMLKAKKATEWSLIDVNGHSENVSPHRLVMNLGVVLKPDSRLRLGDHEYQLDGVEMKDSSIMFKDFKTGKFTKRDKWSCWVSYNNFTLDNNTNKAKLEDAKWGEFKTSSSTYDILQLSGLRKTEKDHFLVNSLKFDASGFAILNISGQNWKISSLKKERNGDLVVYPQNSSPILLEHHSYALPLQDLVVNKSELEITQKPNFAEVSVKSSKSDTVKFKSIDKEVVTHSRSDLMWKLHNEDPDSKFSLETTPGSFYKLDSAKNPDLAGAWVSA